MTRQTSIQLTEATDRQVKALTEQGFGTFTDIVRIAIDRMYTETRKQEAQEMKERAVDVVVINDIDAAIGIIRDADEQGVFDDNGGDPDGPAWIIEAGELGAALKPVVEQGVGHNARGVRVEGYNGSDQHRAWMDAHFQYWCGFSSRKLAYGIR